MKSFISIRRSHVPKYLHNSELYLSLSGEDDDEISVPADCMKMKAHVSNEAELENLLLTMRYWILHDFPRKAIKYILNPPSDGIISVLLKPVNFEAMTLLEKYKSTFPMVHNLVSRLNSSPSYYVCNLCAEFGRLDFLKYFVQLMRPVTVYTLQIAANNGHADCLSICYRLLRRKGVRVVLSKLNWSGVIQNNHVSCLPFLVKHKVPISTLLDVSIKTGSFQCLRYLYKQLHVDCWVPSTVTAAVQAGHYALVRQLLEHGCPWDESALLAAVRADKPRILEYLLQHSAVSISEEFLQYQKPSLECALVIALAA